jgi:hypothetical protein
VWRDILIGLVVWTVGLWLVWRYRLVDRLLSLEG